MLADASKTKDVDQRIIMRIEDLGLRDVVGRTFHQLARIGTEDFRKSYST